MTGSPNSEPCSLVENGHLKDLTKGGQLETAGSLQQKQHPATDVQWARCAESSPLAAPGSAP